MIPNFPSYIFINDSTIQKEIRNNVLRTEMNVGPSKNRPIQCRPMYDLTFNITFCDDKIQDFENWFQGDIGHGAYWFLLNDPISGESKRFRFTQPPRLSKIGNIYTSNFSLEAYSG